MLKIVSIFKQLLSLKNIIIVYLIKIRYHNLKNNPRKNNKPNLIVIHKVKKHHKFLNFKKI
jgi:hypothetical protein